MNRYGYAASDDCQVPYVAWEVRQRVQEGIQYFHIGVLASMAAIRACSPSARSITPLDG